MANAAVQNPVPASGETKSSKKKKAKAEANGRDRTASASVPAAPPKENSSHEDVEDMKEHPYVKELSKQVRNTNKKLSGMQKIDAIVESNPGVSIGDLVKQKKLNADQQAALRKKPQLQAQLTQLEEQIVQYRKFESDWQAQLQKQKEGLIAHHTEEIEKVKAQAASESVSADQGELRNTLLVFTQFLRCAAAKRHEEDDDSDLNRAFEGALLLVYGGDEQAVDAAINITGGADVAVPDIQGVKGSLKYSDIKRISMAHAPFQAEETWVDSVAEANHPAAEIDPTMAHAGLTESDAQTNGINAEELAATDAHTVATGNTAGESWDTTAAEANTAAIAEGYEVVPRPLDEVHTSAAAPVMEQEKQSWADETHAEATGNLAAEGWDIKPAGAQETEDAPAWATEATEPNDRAFQVEDGDGFHQVGGRSRGRGGRARGGDGDFRGRGRGRGGFRGGPDAPRGRGGQRRGGGSEGGRGRGRGAARGGADTGQSRGS